MKRRRMKLRKGPLRFRTVLIISFILFIGLTILALEFIDKGIEPTLLLIADKKTEEVATLALNEIVMEKIVGIDEMKDIVSLEKDKDGNIISSDLNYFIINRIQRKSNEMVQSYLDSISNGEISVEDLREGKLNDKKASHKKSDGVIEYIPLGQAMKNSILANEGPKIPVKFVMVGDVKTKLEPTVKKVGINNTWIQVVIKVNVDVQTVIPFATKTKEVDRDYLVVGKFIPGEVPQFYSESGTPIQPTVPYDAEKTKKSNQTKEKKEE
ncbi:sporulation protein YunB [Fictibacillus sp. Mic-4]|uniref:sporulation protein YunB n=1 Tax=Fictibacillus TaxID=1329200 RepID=UPI000420D8D7|nr:sporulation protein YunB [Fictibacillus gelatini]